MKVEIGNPFALEGYRIPTSEDPEKVHYRSMDGERVLTLYVPEGMSVAEAASTIVDTVPRHLDVTRGLPAWVESDNAEMQTLLTQHYGLNPKRKRPPTWGDGRNGPYPTPQNPNPKKE